MESVHQESTTTPTEDPPLEPDTPERDLESGSLNRAFDTAGKQVRDTIDRIRGDLAELDLQDRLDRARTWVREHPGASIGIAVGFGLLAGRLLAGTRREPEPRGLRPFMQSGAERLSTGARELAAAAADTVRDSGERISQNAGRVRASAARMAAPLAERADEVREDLRDVASRSVDSLASGASGVADGVRTVADSLSERLRDSVPSDGLAPLRESVRAILTAAAVKKIGDWIRRVA